MGHPAVDVPTIILPFAAQARRSWGDGPSGGRLYGGEEAEEIGAEEFVEVGGGVAAGEQGGGDFGQVGGGVDALGEGAYAVEVGADADVVDACDADDVVEVGDERCKRGRGMRAANSRSRRLAMW